MIKNPRTLGAAAVRELAAGHRLALTGTPLENHLGELWSIMHFVLPGLLGDRAGFPQPLSHADREASRHRDRRRAAARAGDSHPALHAAPDQAGGAGRPAAPDRDDPACRTGDRATRPLRIDPRGHGQARARGARRSGPGAGARSSCSTRCSNCGRPAATRLSSSSPARARRPGRRSATRLIELLATLVVEGRKALVFSQFTSMLDLIEIAIDGDPRLATVARARLDGDTDDRAGAVARFQEGGAQLFLLSLKAGGVGLNLTAADTVIHYDPWWNPAVEHQATDRAHRIGQEKPVFVVQADRRRHRRGADPGAAGAQGGTGRVGAFRQPDDRQQRAVAGGPAGPVRADLNVRRRCVEAWCASHRADRR